jgi:isopenicillin N synthase-like dioxygenase
MRSLQALPVLDLGRFRGDPAARAGFLAELRQAARGTGFFQLVGHGIAEGLAQETLAAARRFFALPEAEKRAVAMVNSPHFRGYTRAGAELTRGRPDWREQFDIAAERPPLPGEAGSPPWARLQGPNQWPDALPALRPALLGWQAEMTRVLSLLLEAFAAALGQREDTFAALCAGAPNQHLKIIRYPGLSGGGGQGVGANKDSELLSAVLQDSEGGLQVETASDWIDAAPRPGALVVNIGELLELASDGYLRATIHRVLAPPEGRERLSVAFFLGARLDAVVEPLHLPPALKAEAPGPARDPANPLFREVGRNYLKGRLRSHPDVAQRHHADLLEGEKNLG